MAHSTASPNLPRGFASREWVVSSNWVETLKALANLLAQVRRLAKALPFLEEIGSGR